MRNKEKNSCGNNNTQVLDSVIVTSAESASEPSLIIRQKKLKRKISETETGTYKLQDETSEKSCIKKGRKDISLSNNVDYNSEKNKTEIGTDLVEDMKELPNSQKKKHKKKKNKRSQQNPEKTPINLVDTCVEYLDKWKNDRSNWKFAKSKQMRLISYMFQKEKMPEESFSIFVEYMAGASESIKKLISSKVNEVITEMENWESLSEEGKLNTPKLDEDKYERARCLVQNLE